jgi:DNA polymerase epsilon subunit 1
MFNVRL